jgi:rod shape-determining protein MreD
MSKTFLQFVMLFIVLVIAQSVIFNHIALFSVALAFVFIYFIVRLPITLPTPQVIAISFLIGAVIDVFSDTPGMHAMACTFLGTARRTVLRLYVSREEDITRPQPSIRSLGFAVFAKYVLTMSLVFCIVVFFIEAFSFFNFPLMLLRIVASTLLTSALLIAADSFAYRSSEKRL